MTAIRSTPGALRLLVASVAARLALPMLGVGLLVHARHLTGSFAVAGAVTGAYAVAEGVGAPALGRLVDRRGQTAVLLGSAGAAAVLLAVMAVLPVGAAPALLVVLAAGIGLATPPAGACVRSLLPGLIRDPDALRVAYAVDTTVLEVSWVSGPPIALTAGAVLSTGAALAVGGGILLAGTVAFALQPASRRWRPTGRPVDAGRGGSLRSPGLRTLVFALLATGVLFGAVEVAVTAVAQHQAGTAAGGPLLALWGLGSLIGGVAVTRLGGGARGATGLVVLLTALAVGHLALMAATGSLIALGTVLVVAGAAIAPTETGVYALVERVAPAGTMTEAFAWLATAVAVGSAAGSAVAGGLVDHAGPAAAIAVAGGAGVLAAVCTALRAGTLAGPATATAPAPAAA